MTSIWCSLLGLPFRQSFYDVAGIRTRCVEAGEGEPLVFLHGTGGHAEAYARNLAAHAERFHVYAIDMVGHGFSDKPDIPYTVSAYVDHVVRFLDVIGAERACLSGESLGAVVAAWIAIEHPARVRRLAMNTGLPVARDPEGEAELKELLARTQAAAQQVTREAVRRRLEWLVYDPADVTDELVDVRYAIYSAPGAAEVMRTIAAWVVEGNLGLRGAEEARRWASPESLREIQCPTLVLWTDHNPSMSATTARAGARHIPNARFELLDHCAHWPQWERPADFNALHLEFLTQS
jgi:2-hydroxy-6-oxonona-2,4-dienedioate hydrolase